MDNKVHLVEEGKVLASEVNLTEDNKIQNENTTTELHFELLKQYAWLSSAFIGAVVVLIQLKLITFEPKIFIVIGCFSFSILNCLFGQDFMVESLTKGKSIYDISSKIKVCRHLAVGALGVGSGLLAMLIYKTHNLVS